jgi:hypothetical protein
MGSPNNETRNLNETRSPNDEKAPASGFVIRHSFGFLVSSFGFLTDLPNTPSRA